MLRFVILSDGLAIFHVLFSILASFYTPFFKEVFEKKYEIEHAFSMEDAARLGMISHKMSLITIFGHKHFRQKIHQDFDIFHEKISTAGL